MTNLFKGELGTGLAFLGDLAEALTLEDMLWLRENTRKAKKVGAQSVLTGMVEIVHNARTLLWEKVNDTTIRVNLSAGPKLFLGAQVVWDEGWGWVTIERKGDDLYVDGKKIECILMEEQKMGSVRNNDLRQWIDMSRALHSNILDALMKNTHLIPELWKPGKRRTCFGGVGFHYMGKTCIRYCYWHDGDEDWAWGYASLRECLAERCAVALSAN